MRKLNLYIKESGNKQAARMIVFLHGGGVSGWMWSKQIPFFENSFCLIPDLPGHGRSPGNPPFSICRTAEQLNEVISTKADGREIVVFGFSLGAQILVEMICQRPGLIDYAIVNSALLRPMPTALKLIEPSVRISFPLTRYRWFSRWQASTLYVNEVDFEQYYAETLNMKREMLVSVLKENMSYSISPRIQESTTKLLVTVGEKERGIVKKSAEDLVQLSENADGIIFPGVGHGIPLADPALFNRVVNHWLNTGTIPEGTPHL
ncbi:alpha/beta fold hydrolase [Paenibacillus sp. JZ16]|uniref:alpha/beta fold hydrolase n=1 Tax=Paenibacillus sp. JZ16 TaxID=1906272 RepID=UPI001F216AA7|nr:alpha/beta hydrolase [Paenibacillus sp. JZ16]